MKIDLTDPIVQRIVEDDRPIAVRKRRRSVVNKANSAIEASLQPSRAQQEPKTPSKSKKKVRFSDPGPDINSSTGLTPALRCTSLGTPFGVIERADLRWPATPSNRRVSLPPITTTWDSSSPVKLQFAPIRQVLTPRLKRQFARRDVSDEMNKIEDEKKLFDKQDTELKELREELVRLRATKTPADETYVEDSQLQVVDPEIEQIPPILNTESSSMPDSQADTSMSSLSPDCSLNDSAAIFIDPDCQDIEDLNSESPGALVTEYGLAKVDQAIQTEASLNELENHVATQTIHLTKARLELERIFPGETTLPLTPPANGDCSPLVNALLVHLQTAQNSIHTTKKTLTSVQVQKNNLQGNFNQSLAKLDVARESYAELLRGARAGAEKYAQARQRITTLESEVEEGHRSSDKLRTALDTYRAEVHALESLITRLEEDGKERLERLKGEMDEAVADLECAVSAETKGRRAAENELDLRALQVRVLEGSQNELKEAIVEKQAIVRSLEEELNEVKSGKEQEIGFLNVRIGRLEEQLTTARSDISRLEKEKTELNEQLNGKQSKELQAIGQLKAELRRAVKGVEGVVGDWEKEVAHGTDSIRVAGLMTPSTDGGRFHDVDMDTVEGTVEVTRGKSRRSRKVDSAIGILDEDIMDD